MAADFNLPLTLMPLADFDAAFEAVARGQADAVNLSTRQFRDDKLVQIVREALEESGLPARLLKLEITECAA